MFALYFNDSQGAREFVTTIDDQTAAMNMARLLSRQDPRNVVVIENRGLADTVVCAVFRHGQPLPSAEASVLTALAESARARSSPGLMEEF